MHSNILSYNPYHNQWKKCYLWVRERLNNLSKNTPINVFLLHLFSKWGLKVAKEKTKNRQNEPICLSWTVIARGGKHFGKKIFFTCFFLKFSRRKDYNIKWNIKIRIEPTQNYLDAKVSHSQLLFFTLAAILSKNSMGEYGQPAAVAAGPIC